MLAFRLALSDPSAPPFCLPPRVPPACGEGEFLPTLPRTFAFGLGRSSSEKSASFISTSLVKPDAFRGLREPPRPLPLGMIVPAGVWVFRERKFLKGSEKEMTESVGPPVVLWPVSNGRNWLPVTLDKEAWPIYTPYWANPRSRVFDQGRVYHPRGYWRQRVKRQNEWDPKQVAYSFDSRLSRRLAVRQGVDESRTE